MSASYVRLRRRRSSERLLALAGLLTLWGCRHAMAPASLPEGWASLVLPPTPYHALYRLSCCGRRDLLAALRGGGATLHLSVVAPPGGALAEAWVDGEVAVVLDPEARCLTSLVGGELPLTNEVSLPLVPVALAVLASGRLPAGAAALPERPGWVAASLEGLQVQVRVTGTPPRCTGLEVRRQGEAALLLSAVMRAHRGLVPGVLEVEVGGQKLLLDLQVWEQGKVPAPPHWLGAPPCGGGG